MSTIPPGLVVSQTLCPQTLAHHKLLAGRRRYTKNFLVFEHEDRYQMDDSLCHISARLNLPVN